MREGPLLLLLGVTAFSTPASAGVFDDAVQETAAAEAPADSAAPTVELGGYVRSDLFVGRAPDKDAAEVKSGYGELALTAKAAASEIGDGYAELRLRRGLEWSQDVREARLREAYTNIYLGPVDVRLGQQIIAWGRADGFNPTDNLTPRDMALRSANEDDRRTSNLALRSWLYFQPLKLELVWVPFYQPTTLPPLELPAGIALGEVDRPDEGLPKGIAAARLHLVMPVLDASISYLAGHATMPGIRLGSATVTEAGPALDVGLTSYRHQVVGLDFATTVAGSFGLRGEAAYSRPFDYETRADVPLPDLQLVLGVDFERGDLWVIAQYIGRWVQDWTALGPRLPDDIEALSLPDRLALLAELDQRAQNELAEKLRAIYGQQQELSHAASVRVRWSLLHETLEAAVLGYYSFTNHDALVRPTLTYAVADALEATAGGEIFSGPDDTMYGLADQIVSAGFVELRASF
jgi:hypothetical protein